MCISVTLPTTLKGSFGFSLLSVFVRLLDFVGLRGVNSAYLTDDVVNVLIFFIFSEHDGHVELERLGQVHHEAVGPVAVLGTIDFIVERAQDLREGARFELRPGEESLERVARNPLQVCNLLRCVLLESLKVSIEASCSLWHLTHEPLFLLLHGA